MLWFYGSLHNRFSNPVAPCGCLYDNRTFLESFSRRNYVELYRGRVEVEDENGENEKEDEDERLLCRLKRPSHPSPERKSTEVEYERHYPHSYPGLRTHIYTHKRRFILDV